jgi:serine/threonine protein kinase, bacterial
MSYCVNPDCTKPKNLPDAFLCQCCGSRLLVRNRYRATKSLGQGGFGATFAAVDMSLPGEPICVLKQLRPSNNHEKFLRMARELFEREARTLGKIGNHPQVPRLLDYFEERQNFYLVQDFVSGITLHQEVRKEGLFGEEKIHDFLVQILPVIQYVHSKEVIHRDIKPANIIRRDQDNKLVLIDFGAVKSEVSQVADDNMASGNMANTIFAVGTSGYAPPEQLAMRPMYASDLYALGVTCIYLMTGKSPKDIEHHDKTGEMLWQKQVKLSTSMLAILGKMLEPSVKHRYQSSEQVMRSLELAAKPLVSVGAPAENGARTIDGQRPIGDHRPPPPPPGNGSQASPAQKLAQTIRENREKAATRSSFDPTVVDQPQAPRSGRKREVQRMDAATLLKTYQRGQKSFNDVDLSNLSLTNANLPSAVWENTNFSGSNLQNANLGKGKFVKTNFAEATLRGANLAKGQFPYANLQSADLRGANLSNAQMQNANLMGANLCGANLRGAAISDEQMNMAKTNFLTIFPNGKRGGFW